MLADNGEQERGLGGGGEDPLRDHMRHLQREHGVGQVVDPSIDEHSSPLYPAESRSRGESRRGYGGGHHRSGSGGDSGYGYGSATRTGYGAGSATRTGYGAGSGYGSATSSAAGGGPSYRHTLEYTPG